MWKFQCKLNTLILSLILLQISHYGSASTVEISSYAKVSKNGDSIKPSSTAATAPAIERETSTIIAATTANSRSTLIDKLNVTTATVTANEKETKTQSVNDDKSLNGKSTGRAIQNDYYFPLRNFLTRPIRQRSDDNINYNNNVNEKSPRYIVYPSYTANNINDNEQANRRIQGQPTAQDRFSPGEAYAGTIYKIKHPEKAAGYQYKPPKASNPPAPPAPTAPAIQPISFQPPTQYLPSQFNGPIVVPDNSPPARPTYLPPQPQVPPTYLPPEVMAVKDAISSYGPPPSGSKMVFVTPPSDETETGPDPINDFPPNNNNPDNSYEPDLIIDLPKPFEVTKDDPLIETSTEYSPPKDLLNFPPNVNSKYYPPGMVVAKNQINSYIPPPSGNKDEALPPSDHPSPKYQAPKDLHNFPPNVDSSYNPQQARNPDSQISSYLPPPSGNKDEVSVPDAQPKYKAPKDLHNFPPNVDSSYLPPEMRNPNNPISSYLPPLSGNKEAYLPPKKYSPPKDLFYFPPNIDSQYLPPEMRTPQNHISSYLPPPSEHDHHHDHEHDHHHDHDHHDHDHHHEHYGPPPSDPPSGPPADEHDHHHHHHHHDAPPADAGPPSMPPSGPPDMMPTGPPADEHHHHHHDDVPPTGYTPEPEEPRVKKYSYYYLGRKLWYIPLYFTLWFCLYVAALIFRSIGRHKVDLPNHYTARGARSLHDLSHKETVEKIDKITQFTMAQIEDFKEKYL
ncbi:unnamed protein product [Diamesa hyperborea]